MYEWLQLLHWLQSSLNTHTQSLTKTLINAQEEALQGKQTLSNSHSTDVSRFSSLFLVLDYTPPSQLMLTPHHVQTRAGIATISPIQL